MHLMLCLHQELSPKRQNDENRHRQKHRHTSKWKVQRPKGTGILFLIADSEKPRNQLNKIPGRPDLIVDLYEPIWLSSRIAQIVRVIVQGLNHHITQSGNRSLGNCLRKRPNYSQMALVGSINARWTKFSFWGTILLMAIMNKISYFRYNLFLSIY